MDRNAVDNVHVGNTGISNGTDYTCMYTVTISDQEFECDHPPPQHYNLSQVLKRAVVNYRCLFSMYM